MYPVYPYVVPSHGSYAGYAAMMERFNLDQRAQNIEDMFGAHPLNFSTFHDRFTPTSWGLASMIAVLGAGTAAAIGVAIGGTLAAPLMLGVLAVGGALVGGGMIVGTNQHSAMKDYSTYLSEFANRARTEHERLQAAAVMPAAAQGHAQEKQWASDVSAARENPVAASLTSR